MKIIVIRHSTGFVGVVHFALLWLAAVASVSASVVFQPFHHFYGITGDVNGKFLTQPNPPLIQATDGNLYGTVAVGGMYGFGYVFRVSTNGAFTIVYSFSGGSDGGTAEAALLQAKDGNFYGTTADGGTDYAGTVFLMTVSGSLAALYSFTGGADGATPETAVVEAADGNLYGAASGGPQLGALFRITKTGTLTPLSAAYGGWATACLTLASGGDFDGAIYQSDGFFYGEVFRLTTNGNYTTLDTFPGDAPNGLAQAADGNFYGTTLGGGFFRLDTNGVVTPLYTFPVNGAYYPNSKLMLASDGRLYGATSGMSGAGRIFQITTNGAENTIYQFAGGNDGNWPSALVQARDGYLYGTTDAGGVGNRGTIFKISTNGAFTTLASFPSPNTGQYPDGNFPDAGMVQGSDGALYGTTPGGGALGGGTAFRVDANGNYAVIFSFSNGVAPSALVQGDDGGLYGSSQTTGPHGVIYRLTTNGTYSTVYSFAGGADGAQASSLVKAAGSNFFGAAASGGASNSGTIFQLTTNGGFTLLYTFTNGADGAQPAGLVFASDGNCYGVAYAGGSGSNGTFFRVTPNGTFNLLHSFTGGDDGGQPWGASLLATNGSIYGTTFYGGVFPARAGTVFRLATAGHTFSTLYSFTGGTDGNNPTGLAMGSDGNLYGTTKQGGSLSTGTVFQISTNGTFSVIHNFDEAGSDGSLPLGSLASASDGNIYGTANSGGGILGGFGTLFRVVITPTNAPIPALQFPAFSSGNLSFGFQAAAGQSYFIQQSRNVAGTNWTFFTNVAGGSFVQLSVPATNAAQFFRLREP